MCVEVVVCVCGCVCVTVWCSGCVRVWCLCDCVCVKWDVWAWDQLD